MDGLNLVGWVLLVGGFLFSVVFGWLQAGEGLWLGAYAAILAGLTILLSNLIRALWGFISKRND